MTSSVAIIPNESHKSSANDQLLFLEKLKYTYPGRNIQPSFVQSDEFQSLLKQFKRDKQKAEDEKKWEAFLEKRKEEEISKKKIEQPQSYYSPIITSPDILDYNIYNCQYPYLVNNSGYCQFEAEQPNIWLNDTYMKAFADYYNSQELENKYTASSDINNSSQISFNNELSNANLINEESYHGIQRYWNDHTADAAIQGNLVLNLNKQDNSVIEGFDIEQPKEQSSKSDKICDNSCKHYTLIENSSIEIDRNTSRSKSSAESVFIPVQKNQVIPQPSKASVQTDNTVKSCNKTDENLRNDKNSSVSEPESSAESVFIPVQKNQVIPQPPKASVQTYNTMESYNRTDENLRNDKHSCVSQPESSAKSVFIPVQKNQVIPQPSKASIQTDNTMKSYNKTDENLRNDKNSYVIEPESSAESVCIPVQKNQIISQPSKVSVETDNTMKSYNKTDENLRNDKNSYVIEPEENYCKTVAKKIQDIPGVDYELRKVEDLRIKMTPLLANIKMMIAKSRSSPFPSDEDLERIKQRTLEFGARFKRNYSYRTNCQVNKIKEMLPNTLLVSKKSKILLVIQQHTAVHQAVFQALQVIDKQLQNISIFGKTQELICSFYNCIYELTLTLKPFYGYLKAQVLDEVEKHLVETIDLLKNFKLQDKFSVPNKITKQKKNQSKSFNVAPPWMKKSAALARLKFGPPMRVRKRKSNQEQNGKLLETKPSKHSLVCDQGEKGEQRMDKNIGRYNFMMSVKQRPGAELRRANLEPIKTEEPKTMMELISRKGFGIDNFFKDEISNIEHSRYNNQPTIDKIINKVENEKVKALRLAEKIGPKNVKLIFIKREDLPEEVQGKENDPTPDISSPSKEDSAHFEELLKYREEFKKYKMGNTLYQKNILNTVVGFT